MVRLEESRKKSFHDFRVFNGEFQGEGGFPGIEMWRDDIDQLDFLLGFLVAAFGFLLAGVPAFLQGGEIGEDEFGVDDLDVADGIDGAEFVDDVVVFETAHDLDDGIDFADVGEEFVAESGTFGGAFDEARDIDELDGGGDEFLRSGDFREDG